MPMALAPGRPPDDCMPTTSTSTTRTRDNAELQLESLSQAVEECVTEKLCHTIAKYLEEMARLLREESETARAKRSYHGNPSIGRDKLYKNLHNKENDENTTSKTSTTVLGDNKEKLENERNRSPSGTAIPFQRKMAKKREESKSYESGYTGLGKENIGRKPDCNKIKPTMGKKELFTQNMIPRLSRGYFPKKPETPKQKTLAIKEDERNKEKSSGFLHESNNDRSPNSPENISINNLEEKIKEDKEIGLENSGNLSNLPQTSEKLQNNDRNDNFLDHISRKNGYEKQINNEENSLLEIEKEKKRKEQLREIKKLSLKEQPLENTN